MTPDEAHKAAVEKAGEAAAIHSNTPNAAEAAITAYLAAMEAAGFVVVRVPEEETPDGAWIIFPEWDAPLSEDTRNGWADGWNACRAAVLARPKVTP